MTVFLGVDIGTQGAKAVLCSPEGEVLASAYREQAFDSPHPGWAELDPEAAWWGSFVALTTTLLDQAGLPGDRIAGIGISAFVPALVMLDENDRPLRPAILYTDRRSNAQVEWIRARMRSGGYEPESYGRPEAGTPIPQLLWVREHEPDVYRKTARILQCHSYIVYRLTGRSVIDHALKRVYTPLYDPATGGWSPQRADLIGIDPQILPEQIDWAGSPAGQVTRQAAGESGLAAGTPVAVSTADAFAEMVGAGAVEPGSAAAIYGSFTAIMIARDEPESDWQGHHCLPGLYFSGAAVPTGAVLTRWFRDQFGQPETEQARSSGKSAYQLLDELAAQAPPGGRGLVALPDFSGDRKPGGARFRRGALLGLSVEHTRADIYRALLEGIAYELRWQLTEANEKPSMMMASGGGSRSLVWTQIVSDVLGVEQHALASAYAAAIGSAYLAGMAAGWFPDLIPLQTSWVRTSRTVLPRPDAEAVYEQGFQVYGQAREALWGAG
ncbi:MAG: FGGY family carbohydrate kinase [Anaerolineales bacterium]|nr:FGGY family carbohydrate kinase [Anaerolineales bacterium]